MKIIVKTELYKLKRYSVVWIGIATMLAVVLLARFMATASDGATHTLSNFSSSVIWNNLVLIYPATITLMSGYMIERERTDDTMKNLLTIPLSFRKLLTGKLLTVGLLTIVLSLFEFGFTMLVFFMSGFPGFSFEGAIQVLFQMIGMNLFAYIAVLPIIAFTGQRSGSLMGGVGFAFFYGFIGMMASGHGLRDLYPITAGLSLIRYQDTESTTITGNLLVSVTILLMILLVTVLIVLNAKNRERKTPSKKPKSV
ncbi:ABC transporter permease [Enterococcus sp. 669A]|uniref:ABC transporter permease n=1 Tax=Candidatus Enterococcus moelleringii TaxID=2815325 RepID=A0ABS3LEG3_9ENTE|nr:ABC transporter permease [Enterococcus sp. 669A]MBO1308036.1 ABC transporter permease [Enterococcus sp. 669A]